MSLLIEQHDKLDYCNFDHENLNVYQLSGFQLVFSGYTKTQNNWEPEWAKYTPYQVDIHSSASFPAIPDNLISPGDVLNYRNMTITEVFWRHFVPYGDDVAAIGYCDVKLILCQVIMDAFQDIDDLRNPEQLGAITLDRIHGDVADRNRFIYPKTFSDLKQYDLKDRLWLQSDQGNLDTHRKYGFHTALTHEHILTVSFRPRGHWEQGTAPTPSQLEKVFVSFWDFMDHLTITEEPSVDQRLEPGETLRGERKVLQEEYERSEKESKDAISGW